VLRARQHARSAPEASQDAAVGVGCAKGLYSVRRGTSFGILTSPLPSPTIIIDVIITPPSSSFPSSSHTYASHTHTHLPNRQMLSSILRQQRVAAASSASSSSSRVLASSPLLRGLVEASNAHARDPYNYQLIYVPVRGLTSWWGMGNKEGGGGAAGAAGGKGKGGGADKGGGGADKGNGGGISSGEGGGSSSGGGGSGSSKEGERVVVVENRGSKGSGSSSSSNGHPNDAVAKVGAGENAPRHPHVLALPILRRPFFPGLVQAVNITSPKVFEAISGIKNDYGHYYVGTFMRKEEPTEGSPPEVITDMSQIHAVGTLAQVQNTIPLGMGGQVVLVSHRRIKIDGPFAVGPPLRVKVSHLEGKTYDPDSILIKAYSNEVRKEEGGTEGGTKGGVCVMVRVKVSHFPPSLPPSPLPLRQTVHAIVSSICSAS